MERHAQKKRAKYWLDKTLEHTLMIDKLAALYPNAKFVAIIRNSHDVMRSSIGRYTIGTKQQRYMLLARGALNLAQHNREIMHFTQRSERVHILKFEAMKQDTSAVLQEVCRFLEITFETDLLTEAYRPNTTFYKSRKRDEVLSKSDEKLIDFTTAFSDYIPLNGFRAIRRLTGKKTKKPLPKWFFSMYPPVFEKQPERL